MAREIKFRAKSLDGIWEYGDLHLRSKHPHIHHMIGASIYIYPDTVGQFTGLHDKNGKEIYEGDIVRFNGKFFTGNNIFCVDYEGSHRGGFSLCTKDGYYSIFGEAFLEPFYCEVIGNIHDNKELLEGGEK